MTIDSKALLALWKLEDIFVCDWGLELAHVFMESCGEGINRLGIENPAERIADITTCYMALVEHGEACDQCNEA
jgi:hypothetical protein